MLKSNDCLKTDDDTTVLDTGGGANAETDYFATAIIDSSNPAFTRPKTLKSAFRVSGLAGAAMAFGMATVTEISKGALIPDGADQTAYMNYASQFQGRLVSVNVTYQGSTVHSSGVLINSQYVLTAGHVAYSPAGTIGFDISVGTGLNYVTSPGNMDAVSNVTTYPGFNYTENGPDISILRLSNPIPVTPLSITGSYIGESLTMAGFGQEGTPSTGLSPQNGASEAFNVRVVQGVLSNFSDQYYNSGDFDSTLGLVLNGRGASGDSGGPVFDNQGDLVGTIVGGSLGTSSLGTSEYLDFGQPDVQQWVLSNSAVPEPSTLSLLALGSTAMLARRQRRLSQV